MPHTECTDRKGKPTAKWARKARGLPSETARLPKPWTPSPNRVRRPPTEHFNHKSWSSPARGRSLAIAALRLRGEAPRQRCSIRIDTEGADGELLCGGQSSGNRGDEATVRSVGRRARTAPGIDDLESPACSSTCRAAWWSAQQHHPQPDRVHLASDQPGARPSAHRRPDRLSRGPGPRRCRPDLRGGDRDPPHRPAHAPHAGWISPGDRARVPAPVRGRSRARHAPVRAALPRRARGDLLAPAPGRRGAVQHPQRPLQDRAARADCGARSAR